MGQAAAEERIREVGSRLYSLVLRTITAVVVLVVFAGLVFLVYAGRVVAGALLLHAGVILGYIIHATKQSM